MKYKKNKVSRIWFSNPKVSQIAVLYKVDSKFKQDWYIDKIRITLSTGLQSKDTMKFNLRIYAYDSINNRPGDELYNKPILVNAENNSIKKVNLRDYKIQIPPDYFFVAVEWLFIEENRFTFGNDNRSSPKNCYLPFIVELKESKDIMGVWWFSFNQNWRKRNSLDSSISSLDISVTLRD